MLKHNKKRNIGLLSEFFAQYIAKAVVDFRQNDIDKATNLWRKYIFKNKELFEEYKIFDMYEKMYIKNNAVANEFLKEARNKIIKQDFSKVEKLKTNFIHEINKELQDQNFFNAVIDKNKYKSNANLQMLINCWRENNNSLSDISYYKLIDQIVEHITTEKQKLSPLNETVLNNTKEDIDHMIIKIFKEKIEKKYNSLLSEEQKKIIGWFVFAKDKEDAKKQLTEALHTIKNNTLTSIAKELQLNNNKNNIKKLNEVKQTLINEHYDCNNPTEEMINFYLIVCNLKNELES